MNKFVKTLITGSVSSIVTIGLLSSCDNTDSTSVPQSAASKEANVQGNDSSNLINNQPIPSFQYSQARQTLINAETIEANGENTTTFGLSNNGSLIWTCSSIGMPVPADAQLSNPNQIIQDPNGGGYNLNQGSLLMPQMDPFGIYTGQTTGTYTLCVNKEGKQYLQYWEGYTDSVSGPATYDNNTHTVQMLGEPDPIKPVPSISATK